MTIKTLQSGRHIFRSRHAGTITINVGMLETIHQLRKLNKWTINVGMLESIHKLRKFNQWTLIVYLKL
jgi:hypothetical protein